MMANATIILMMLLAIALQHFTKMTMVLVHAYYIPSTTTTTKSKMTIALRNQQQQQWQNSQYNLNRCVTSIVRQRKEHCQWWYHTLHMSEPKVEIGNVNIENDNSIRATNDKTLSMDNGGISSSSSTTFTSATSAIGTNMARLPVITSTASVYLLEPNEPIASLSSSSSSSSMSSVYTFPSSNQQQQQQPTKKYVPYFNGNAMNPNTASMLVTQQQQQQSYPPTIPPKQSLDNTPPMTGVSVPTTTVAVVSSVAATLQTNDVEPQRQFVVPTTTTAALTASTAPMEPIVVPMSDTTMIVPDDTAATTAVVAAVAVVAVVDGNTIRVEELIKKEDLVDGIGSSAMVDDLFADANDDNAIRVDELFDTVVANGIVVVDKVFSDEAAEVSGDNTVVEKNFDAVPEGIVIVDGVVSDESKGDNFNIDEVFDNSEGISIFDESLHSDAIVDELLADERSTMATVTENVVANETIINESIAAVNEDQMVVNDLFVINDVYGVDPFATLLTKTTTLTESIVTEDTMLVASSLVNNVGRSIDSSDVDAHGGALQQEDGNLEDIDALKDFDNHSSDDIDDVADQVAINAIDISATTSTSPTSNDATKYEEVTEFTPIGNNVDVDKDRVVTNDLFEVCKEDGIDQLDSITDPISKALTDDDVQRWVDTNTEGTNEVNVETEESTVLLDTKNLEWSDISATETASASNTSVFDRELGKMTMDGEELTTVQVDSDTDVQLPILHSDETIDIVNTMVRDSDLQSVEPDGTGMIDDYVHDVVMDEVIGVNPNDYGKYENEMHDSGDEQEMMVEPLIETVTSYDNAPGPLLQRYDNDSVDDAANDLIVQPPINPPQMSDFVRLQSSMVVSLTPEERAELAENSVLSLEVKPGVKVDTIKGAAIATLLVALMAGEEIPIALFGMVPAISYFAITRGKTGETIRILGDISWLWTAKVVENLTAVDTKQLTSAWDAIQSVASRSLTSLGGWIDQQSMLAEEEYYQNQAAPTTSKLPQLEGIPPTSDFFFLSSKDQLLNADMEEKQLLAKDTELEGIAASARSEQVYEKEMEEIRLILEEAERESILAISRSEQKRKERNQRKLLATKLDMDRRSSQLKQALNDHEVARSKLEETNAQQKVAEAYQPLLLGARMKMKRIEAARVIESTVLSETISIVDKEKPLLNDIVKTSVDQNGLSEATQRALLKTRLEIDRNAIARINEARKMATQANERKIKEEKRRSLLAYRLSLERRIASQLKLTAQSSEIAASSTLAESRQRSLLETRIKLASRQKVRISEVLRVQRLQQETSSVQSAEDHDMPLESVLVVDEGQQEVMRRLENEIYPIEDATQINELTKTDELGLLERKNLHARIDEHIKQEEENRLTELARIEDLAREEENRFSDTTISLAGMDAMGRIDEEKIAVDTCTFDEMRYEDLAHTENENHQDISLMDDAFMTKGVEVAVDGLPWINDISQTKDPLELQKPNLDAAEALLKSVRKGSETYPFQKEWWE